MSFPPRVRKEGASMCHKTIKKKKHLLYGVVITVSIVLLLSGIFGCNEGENPPLHEIVSFDTSYYGTERNPVYAFALRKEDGNWLFSASCPVGDRKNHYTSFGPFRSRLRTWKDSLRSFVKQTRSRGSGDIASRFGHVLSIYPMRRRAVPG